MTQVVTDKSIYNLDGNKVMLESGTPSRHLPFGEWVEVHKYAKPVVGERFWITYLDGRTRTTTAVVSIEEPNVGQSSSQQ